MSDARARILSRLRASRAAPAPEVLEREPTRRFEWSREEKIRRFTERMTAVRGEVIRTTREGWVEACVAVCARLGLSNLLYASETPWGAELDQAAAAGRTLHEVRRYDRDIEAFKLELFYGIDAALTGTSGGIAETGSLILWPTPQEPRLMSLVPPVHIAVLEADRLYTTFAEAVAEQDWAGALPTNALLISGPSKTADIEQTLAYGVHGPRTLAVLLVA